MNFIATVYRLLAFCMIIVSTKVTSAQITVTSAADSGPGTLRQAVLDAPDGSRVDIGSAVYGQPILLNSPIRIDKNLVIDGHERDQVVIDGQGLTRLFEIDAQEKFVHLYKITLRGGATTGSGGAIINQAGKLRLEVVNLIGNVAQTTAEGQGGGAVYNMDSIQVSKCVLRDNEARGSFGLGGAILNGVGADARVTSNSQLIRNHAGGMGGAVASLDQSYLYVRSTTLDSNSVGRSGGAVALLGGICNMYIGFIQRNTAPEEGGGVYVEGADCTIRRFTLAHNTAGGVGGGGIFVRGASSSLLINPQTVLDSNRATHPASIGGGVAVVEGSTLLRNAALYRDNFANAAGGGLAYKSSSSASATNIGGRYEGNQVLGPEGLGGGLYMSTDQDISGGGHFKDNYATMSGGGIWTDTPNLRLTDDTFEGNGCGGGGTDQGGGAIFSLQAHISLRNSVFRSNYAEAPESSGGAILSHRGGITTKETHVFADNSCGWRGGAVCLLTGDYIFASTTFENNSAYANWGSGGAIYGGGSRVRVRYSTLRANTASSRGGGVWASAATTVDVEYGNLIDNLVHGIGTNEAGGGGIYAAGGEVNIVQSTLGHNAALQTYTGHGGGLKVLGTQAAELRLATVSGNTSTGRGGGVYTERGFDMEEVTLAANQAARGGGYSQESGGGSEVSGSIISANYARGATTNFDVAGAATVRSGGYNLIGTVRPDSVLRSIADTLSDDPKLGPLADNGGGTLTHRPLAGSPVVNGGRPTTRSGDVDQIDQPPAGGRREIGSLEVANIYFFADTDGDGYGDPFAPSGLLAAAPNGYVSNNTDNCPGIYNSDQSDADGDGKGDVCDE